MAVTQDPLVLMGVPGSPYTRKMLSLLRYRRIPYRLLPGGRQWATRDKRRFPARPQPKVPLLPTFYLKDENGVEQAVCDSTPLIRLFEEQFQGRSVIPSNPGLAFINYLVEDYADEWLTKAMFHYRWSYAPDIQKASQMLPRWNNNTASESEIADKSKAISALQISRLSYVGSNELTRATIERSFTRFLELFDKHLNLNCFLFGSRPSSSDFAIYGQLTAMALFDPTPSQIIIETAPRVYAWTESMEDLSGYEAFEDDWLELESLPETLVAVLKEIGRLYLPYLEANDIAVRAGDPMLNTELDGQPWVQSPFPYQSKCLRWIKEQFGGLPEPDMTLLRAQLQQTGIMELIA
ncbi:MAG: glutathione S-transferase N-terminal domain-containing protein [Proteobacteria bacterium]|nr:glutathione S-transferase N-terminal domain-containing protein [Pseudomonadota bacterium]MDA1291995.1 glutathione S-transferase N-terminal domain-containing protein [Pseudomonadota bacterium]